MGRRKKRAPRRGSLAFIPRGRAESIKPSVKYWPDPPLANPSLLGFPGYKAGMTHVFMIEDEPTVYRGREVSHPATIVVTPPVKVMAVRLYADTLDGFKALTEVWHPNLSKDLWRNFNTPKEYDFQAKLREFEEARSFAGEVRVIVGASPKLAGLSKKKLDLMEVRVGGGSLSERIDYALSILGGEVRVSDVFKPGQYVDVSAVTKGKGFQGEVKRWHVHRLHHKTREGVRGVGTLGPWTPARVMYTVPRPGQLGFHLRCEYNKRILMIGSDGSLVTPPGGLTGFGVVSTEYVLLKGSTPGSRKRLVFLRYPARPPSVIPAEPPKITYIYRGG